MHSFTRVSDLVRSRLWKVAVCENGHLVRFPWNQPAACYTVSVCAKVITNYLPIVSLFCVLALALCVSREERGEGQFSCPEAHTHVGGERKRHQVVDNYSVEGNEPQQLIINSPLEKHYIFFCFWKVAAVGCFVGVAVWNDKTWTSNSSINDLQHSQESDSKNHTWMQFDPDLFKQRCNLALLANDLIDRL